MVNLPLCTYIPCECGCLGFLPSTVFFVDAFVHFWSPWKWLYPLKRDRDILQKERIVFRGVPFLVKLVVIGVVWPFMSAYPFCYVLKPWSSTAFAYVPLKHHQNMWISISWRPWRTCWTSNWKQLVSWSFSEPFLTPNKRLPLSKALVILPSSSLLPTHPKNPWSLVLFLHVLLAC